MSIDIHVLHRGIGYDLSLLPDDTLAILGTRLETLTAIPATRQKLLYKGKKASHTAATTIKDAGLTHGLKVTMLGSMDQELSSMLKMENGQRRREQIMQDRASKGTVKVRSPFYCNYSCLPPSSQPSLGALGRHGETQFIHLP
jgi:hypothetical protein